MRSILMIVVALTLMGCKNTNDGGEGSNSTTPNVKVSSIIATPGEELKTQGYDDNVIYVRVPNTTRPDYNAYRKQWKRLNEPRLHREQIAEQQAVHDDPVEIELDDLTFREAFIVQYRAKGEGHRFWWRNEEYTTDLLHNNPSVDEE